ncbi:MAG: type II toxin-antitoxin system Phd/YefM family antitoxin [Mixta calida]|mgnify:CR=1 FL=1|uniref:prevent-host-death protein n=1 Tax=Pantoea TaxID=53335 RepID=UPI00065F6F6F|nr:MULTISPECIES: prevent-host-death protein [Pantoea]MDU2733890.1 type II toxin-antitoxin system Phd/YefM family antitoxin [Mixta calida]MBS6437713.1 type II toxin-antitoxin system Phd/YefM family antitoxin [Pantoea sp.]MDU2729286.1 type II toxin-antitoxin system Phd/YefM family antitoxin [Pantoea sp.]MDU7839371.1 type II toxin-antitoxin system Phd/YefM family antitoxin [Pantoea sp.]HAB24774.1 type II toxin-antitoxin system Phd/YefM family antitoxin [Pantoea sp.]
MKIQTISDIKRNAASLDVSEPILVTQNGNPAYVIESWADRQQRDDTLALLRLLALSEEDKQKERGMTRDELLSNL